MRYRPEEILEALDRLPEAIADRVIPFLPRRTSRLPSPI
jgi:hypothetical protein